MDQQSTLGGWCDSWRTASSSVGLHWSLPDVLPCGRLDKESNGQQLWPTEDGWGCRHRDRKFLPEGHVGRLQLAMGSHRIGRVLLGRWMDWQSCFLVEHLQWLSEEELNNNWCWGNFKEAWGIYLLLPEYWAKRPGPAQMRQPQRGRGRTLWSAFWVTIKSNWWKSRQVRLIYSPSIVLFAFSIKL